MGGRGWTQGGGGELDRDRGGMAILFRWDKMKGMCHAILRL